MQKMILTRLEANCFGPKSIPIYGGVYHLYNYTDEPSLDEVIRCINEAVRSAAFFEPDTAPQTVARNVCALCLIDPMLIEVYAGVRIW